MGDGRFVVQWDFRPPGAADADRAAARGCGPFRMPLERVTSGRSAALRTAAFPPLRMPHEPPYRR